MYYHGMNNLNNGLNASRYGDDYGSRQEDYQRPVTDPNMIGNREGVPNQGPSPVPRRRRQPIIPSQAMTDRAMRGRSLEREDTRYSMDRPQRYNTMDDRYYRGPQHGGQRDIRSSNKGSPDDEMFMSDASERSEFSLRSTQSERLTRSRKFSEFSSRMESRGPAGRRQVLPVYSSHASPLAQLPHHEGHDGSMSDSGLSSTITDRRMNRVRHHDNVYGRQRTAQRDSSLHDQRTHFLKQASKDSTDGSICSSDSSNAKNSCENDRQLDIDSERRRGSETSVNSAYEDDLKLAQMCERLDMGGYPGANHMSMDPHTVGDRFTATAAQRSSEPRRGLPVNELVAAASNPNLFTQQAQGLKFKATHNQIGIQNNPAIRDSGYQSSTGSLPSSTQLHTNGPLPGPGMLPGSTVLPRNSSTGSTQWAQPRNGGEGLNDFIEGLGPGQIVGRQVLGTSCRGEIQMGLSDKKGRLELEITRARGLIMKPGAKTLPNPYVKAYLMDGKNCAEKLKTTVAARKTLDPFYNQILLFMEPYMQKVLQVMVWGDYGRMDRKVFMGVAQVNLDDLDLSNIVFGWYKLFTTSTIIGSTARRSSQSSLDSAYSGTR